MFSVGDKVKFELTDDCTGKNLPRWWWNEDKGGNGMWAEGVVEKIQPTEITVAYTIKGFIGTGHCCFPNVEHLNYKSDQWWYEGYLQKVEKPACECGSGKIKAPGHSDWCPGK